jgi:uncharacterized protein with von Willebrand factor type A (vWA) domain
MNTITLPERVILFSRFLKNNGFKVFSSSVIESLKRLSEIDISKREDFFAVLRANLTTTDMEWQLFGELFEEFWRDYVRAEEQEESDEGTGEQVECEGDSVDKLLPDIIIDSEGPGDDLTEKETREWTVYSPVATLERKDLSQFERRDIQIAQLVFKNMISPFRITVTRRFKRSKKPGHMDFRRVLKKSLKSGGIPLELFYRKKRKRLKRLVILADVSGSMDRYARFVMPFIMGLKGVGPKAEVFVFSTALTHITSIIRRRSIEKALERISQEVPDWSGGTRIGYSLHQFNEGYGEGLLNRRTVVVIMSDGWDLGGRELLKREMETLNKKANCIIWLNPLAGDSEYRPVCMGMKTALPYIDYHLPADSLESLKKVGHTLTRVMAGN